MTTETEIYNQINEVLKEWDPIGVPEPALSNEYRRYIPSIIEKKGNEDHLLSFFEDLLINVIGVDYDPHNKLHKQDIIEVVAKIQSI